MNDEMTGDCPRQFYEKHFKVDGIHLYRVFGQKLPWKSDVKHL